MQNKWLYIQDIGSVSCNVEKVYYQDYSYFGNQKPARAVLNGSVVYLVGGEVLKKYDMNGGVCGKYGLPVWEYDSILKEQKFEKGKITL